MMTYDDLYPIKHIIKQYCISLVSGLLSTQRFKISSPIHFIGTFTTCSETTF